MPKAQKHCKLQYFRAWQAAKNQQKSNEKRSKTTSGTHLQILTTFFSTPDPQKHLNPSRVKNLLRGGSVAGGRPHVAKASLESISYGGASPDFRADAHRRLRWITWPSLSAQGGLESYWVHWMRTCFRNIFVILFWTYSWNHGTGILLLSAFFSWSACSRKRLRRVFPQELLPISTFHFV